MKKILLVLISFYVVPGFSALDAYEKKVSNGKVMFFKEPNLTAEQFSGQTYAKKPDAAWLEAQTKPDVWRKMAQSLSADDFKGMTQEELDQVYMRLSSGPIVPGDYRGQAMMKGEMTSNIKNFILKKVHGVNVLQKVCGQRDIFECFMEFAWEGKRIYAPDSATGEYQLRNAVAKSVAHAVKTTMAPAGKKLVDPSNWLLRTLSPFPGGLRYMIFPAHVYCGQSLLDHRRESIVADYAWGSDFSPFITGIDDIFGRNFLNLREEIRMVRPGLYLGRVYAQKIFLFNFVLHNPVAEKQAQGGQWPADACFDGKSTR